MDGMRGSSVAAVLLPGFALAVCAAARADRTSGWQVDRGRQAEMSAADEVGTVIGLVEAFGGKLRMASLSAPADVARENIRERYAGYVSPALLEAWINDPDSAPGRLTSSPWPDRVEVRSAAKTDGGYRVEGEIVEITGDGGEAEIRSRVTLDVRRIDGRWLIDGFEPGGDREPEM